MKNEANVNHVECEPCGIIKLGRSAIATRLLGVLKVGCKLFPLSSNFFLCEGGIEGNFPSMGSINMMKLY